MLVILTLNSRPVKGKFKLITLESKRNPETNRRLFPIGRGYWLRRSNWKIEFAIRAMIAKCRIGSAEGNGILRPRK